MKKIMMLFLLVSFMCFGEEKIEPKKSYEVIQREEIDFLKTQLIRSNNKIDDLSEKIEELEDKGENNLGLTYNVDQIYQNSVQYYDSALTDTKWLIERVGVIVSILLTALLGSTWYIKNNNDKKLKEEKEEVTKELDKRMERMLTENAELKKKAVEQEKEVERKTLKLYETIEQTNKEMDEKLKEVEYNTEFAIAINRSKNEDKIEELKKLVKKYPKKAEIYFELGIYLLNEKKYEEAIPNFNKINELEPKKNRGYAFLGLAYELWGDSKKEKNCIGAKKHFEEAIKNYKEKIKLNPKSIMYKESLEEVEQKLKELEGK
ncbi:MAG: hypothetical protein WBG30_15050 [Psychrilyobacter sp.]|uniref:hypothetical protein n=1 Tax=Psychrilyobacter sp. TaxID=2586924 RepID=UPI003C78BD81